MSSVFIAASGDERVALLRDALVVRVPAVSTLDEARELAAEEGESLAVVDAAAPWASDFVRSVPTDTDCALLVVTDQAHLSVVPALLREGADGFVALPVDRTVFGTAVEAARQARAHRRAARSEIHGVRSQLMRFAEDFRVSYQRERARARELQISLAKMESSYMQTVRSLAAAVEAKDPTTGAHIERVTRLASALARAVDPALAAEPHLAFGFLLHDVGKIGVPDDILLKPAELTTNEFDRMREHAVIGARIIEGVDFLKPVYAIVRHHHERWDGLGYPDRLRGEEIPRGARIFAVADAVDAMMHDRPYRRALSMEETIDQIVRGSGTQFDPEVVKVFVELCARAENPLLVG